MKRRIMLLLVCLSLLLPVFSVSAEQQTQATQTEDQRIRQQIMRVHRISLQRTGHSTLGGRCGLQVSWELYLLGINKSLLTYDGNDHYDAYKDLEQTTGGYTPRAYDAKDYSIKEALNTISRNGTLDVYNIMVGFQRTNTQAGRIYGHVCFIHAILDGMVYCVEGFSTRFGTAEGEPIVITIEQFADWFSSWAVYEGLVYFGTGNPLDSYTYYPCDLFAQCSADADILTVPEMEHSDLLRTARAGERLHVTGLYEDAGGTYYYQVSDDGETGYVNAKSLKPFRFNYEDITYSDPVLPQALEEGGKFQTGGKVSTKYTQLGAVRVLVTEPSGETVLDCEILKDGNLCDMDASAVRRDVDLSILPEGGYFYSVYADVLNHYLEDGIVVTDSRRICLSSTPFTVGQAQMPQAADTPAQETANDGWCYVDGKWYFYENGAPRTGWMCCDGLDYYLDPQGAAVTGWAKINEKMRYFSETGAMRVGWIRTPQGTCYLLRNGVTAAGWRTVDGQRYCFDENGNMRCGGWTELEDKLFYFYADGKTATGWVTLDSGTYSFHADGYLLAMRQEEGDQMQIINYDGSWKPAEMQQIQEEEI